MGDSDDEESGSDADTEDSDDEDGGGAGDVAPDKAGITDMTETNLINLRRTIYLTIMNSVSLGRLGVGWGGAGVVGGQ